VPIYTGWQFFRHPVKRAQGKGYLPRSTTQRLARKGGLVHLPLVRACLRGTWCVCVCAHMCVHERESVPVRACKLTQVRNICSVL